MNSKSTMLLLLLPLFVVCYATLLHDSAAQNATQVQLQTFRDNATGLTFQYPSDWQMLSEEYMKIISESAVKEQEQTNSNLSEFQNLTRPITMMAPMDDSETTLMIFYQALPFPIPAEAFMNASLLSLNDPEVEIYNVSSVLLGDIEGSRANMNLNDVRISQIYITNDDSGFMIQLVQGQNAKQESLENANRIVDSLKLT